MKNVDDTNSITYSRGANGFIEEYTKLVGNYIFLKWLSLESLYSNNCLCNSCDKKE